MHIFKVAEVFTPNTVPTVTYVERSTRDLEKQLRSALQTPGQVVSISGPSKTGKTSLVKTVLDPDDIIAVSGASINSGPDLWTRIVSWMESPSEVTSTASSGNSFSGSLKAAGKVGLPLVASGSIEGQGGYTENAGDEISKKVVKSAIDQVVKDIANSAYTVFIDDFHYMALTAQQEVARQIKEVAERGVRVCTASVPHRADDVVRSNTELRGRVQAVDVGYWSVDEIKTIAQLGFDALNITTLGNVIDVFCKEAFGSPQLMQGMCLQLCYLFDLDKTQDRNLSIDPSQEQISKVLLRTATTTDFSTLVDDLHKGPKPRGLERKVYDFSDGTSGDVYRAVLLAISANPPVLSFNYDDIMRRVKQTCRSDSPVGSSVNEALKQMHSIALDKQPTATVIEWSEDVLDIVDPYFLYYLRCSDRISNLSRKGPSSNLSPT